MNKIYHFILYCFATFFLVACNCNTPEVRGIEGKDHFISDFTLTVGGITYQATIAGDEITVEIPYNASLKGASVEYVLSEGATINPNPATIQDWENEWKFIVTSKMKESKVYSYTYRYADIEKSGSVLLATQVDVDNFAKTGINRIEGNLTIGTADGEEITNLEGLAHLKEIKNALVINPSYKGEDLTGLNNLEKIGSFKLGSTTSISKNTALKLVNLPSLLEVVGDFIINSSVVERVSIPKVSFIGEGMYVASDALLDLATNAVETVGASLIVKGSVAHKGSATTEAIVFPALKSVGNDLTIQYFPKVQGVFLPALESVVGTATFSNLPSIGSLAMTELNSAGGLIVDSNGISTIDLPNLSSCGVFSVTGVRVNKLNISTLKNVSGDITLKYILLEELDLSQMVFNGGTLKLECDRLKKLIGPETFNGSIDLYDNGSRLTEFSIEGIKYLQGDFKVGMYQSIEKFTIPFVRVEGDMIIGLYSSRSKTGAEIEFPNLQEIGGDLKLDSNSRVNNILLPKLKNIFGSCVVDTGDVKNDIEFPNLESIGTSGAETKVQFNIYDSNIICPKLKTINGSLNFSASVVDWGLMADKISFPSVETISGNLSIDCLDIAPGIKSIDFSGLKSVKGIRIRDLMDVSDFSSFKYLFTNNVLTEDSQWIVSNCAYNPTFQDMKDGKYKPAE